jgi:hypothetical protein
MGCIVSSTGRENAIINYHWNESFSVGDMAELASEKSTKLFDVLKRSICEILNINYLHRGWKGYLTRKIRDNVCGPDLESVMAKQITVPIMIPSPLEDIIQSLATYYADLPAHYLSRPFLIPAHNHEAWQANQINPNLPSLTERYSEAGNLRFWVITNESMWSRQHYIIDELTEILLSLAYLTRESLPVDDLDSVWNIASMIRRRAMRPDISTAQFYERVNNTEKKLRQTTSGLPIREVMFFRSWVFAVPIFHRWKSGPWDRRGSFEEDGIIYPVPEELYWIDDGMGSWQINAPRIGAWGDSKDASMEDERGFWQILLASSETESSNEDDISN